MKLRLMICAAVASTALFGEDATSATYAVMNVTNAYTDTVIAVPWVGLDGSAITISNLVNTTTLAEGDKLYMYGADGNWYACTKNASGNWDGSITVSGAGALTPASQQVARGTGLILQRASAGGTVLLCGRVDTNSVSTTIAATGKTLFANPTAAAVDLNNFNKFSAVEGDTIMMPQDHGGYKSYMYDGTEWGCSNKVTTSMTVNGRTFNRISYEWQKGCSIPAGMGAWFESKKSEDRTINW